MRFDTPMHEKESGMSSLKLICTTLVAAVMAITAIPSLAATGQYTEDIQKLYVAYFNRPAAPAELASWEAQITSIVASVQSKEQALAIVSNSFSANSEYASTISGLSSIQIINKIYMNVFGRPADISGLLFWANALDSGAVTIDRAVNAIITGPSTTDAATYSNKVKVAMAFTDSLDTTEKILAYSGAGGHQTGSNFLATVTDAATLVTAIAPATLSTTIASLTPTGPSKEALGAILADLDEITEDLKIEEEDKSADYLRAKGRIDKQDPLKDSTSSPTTLYQRVQDAKAALAAATTDEERKQVADTIVALQTQTQVWTANLGADGVADATGKVYTLPIRANLQAINDRVNAAIQKTIGSSMRCSSVYDSGSHSYVTRCTSG